LVESRKGSCHPIARRLAGVTATGFGRVVGVFVGLPTAEVGRRHVAQGLRGITGRCLGLARKVVRKRMSEAGSRWPSREISGGPQGHVPSASKGRNQWDLPMEGTLGSEKTRR